MAADFTVTNHGSIVLLRPNNDAAREWLDEHVQSEGWQWFGHSLAIEPRYVADLVEGIEADGFTIE